jgi:hypothetical protein
MCGIYCTVRPGQGEVHSDVVRDVSGFRFRELLGNDGGCIGHFPTDVESVWRMAREDGVKGCEW